MPANAIVDLQDFKNRIYERYNLRNEKRLVLWRALAFTEGAHEAQNNE